MKIYEFWPEFDTAYPGLLTEPRDPAQRAFVQHVQMDAHDPAAANDWRVIQFYVDNPLLPTPDFFWWGRYFCCTRATFSRIEAAVAADVKPLPVEIENVSQEYVLLHVCNVRQVAHDEEIDRRYAEQGHFHTAHYLFKWECFERPQIFMNPTIWPSVIFCASDCGDDAHDFYVVYQRLGLTGLQFKCVAQREVA